MAEQTSDDKHKTQTFTWVTNINIMLIINTNLCNVLKPGVHFKTVFKNVVYLSQQALYVSITMANQSMLYYQNASSQAHETFSAQLHEM
jgi:hypothetical protein